MEAFAFDNSKRDALAPYFSDDLFTQLKPEVTSSDSIEDADAKALVDNLLADAEAYKKFRVGEYEAYLTTSTLRNRLKTSSQYNNYENPTGVYLKPGQSCIVMASGIGNYPVGLTIKNWVKNEGDDSRNKYFIVLGKTSDGTLIGFVVINSQINNNLSEPLQQLHYPLAVSKYAFLLKNRYADCGELKEITLENFTDRYNCRSFGKIDEEDLRLITEAVKTSPKETKKHLRKFGLIE